MASIKIKQRDGSWVEIPTIVGSPGKDGDKGDPGISGVHFGTHTPPESANVWINPNGQPTGTEDWEFDIESGGTATKTVVVLGANKTSGELAVLKFRREDGTWGEIPAIAGTDGDDGKSAYEYAKDGGYTGTEAEFMTQLVAAMTALADAKQYTDAEISDLINGAPTTLNTLGEIATAMAENADVVAALDDAIGSKAAAADLAAHTGNRDNPHGVTLAQLGVTATAAELNYVDGVTGNIQTQLNAKAADYSIELYNGNKGNPKPVKFATVDYSTCGSENGVAVKISMVSGHGNGTAYAFMQDAIIRVNYQGSVSVTNIKTYGADAGTYDGATRQYGDIFWVNDTTNKVVDFYCLMGQYARVNMTPFKRVTYSTGGTITQHKTASVYSSGTIEWANNEEIATKSDIPTTPEAVGASPAYTYGTADLTAGSSALETGKLYFVYE